MSRYTVLLIDDEQELVSTLVERLGIRDIGAEAVTDGRHALKRLEETTFDAVVIDVKMPGLGGVELAKIIETKYPDVTILMITGHGAWHGEFEGPTANDHEVLLKPFPIETLVEKLDEFLAR